MCVRSNILVLTREASHDQCDCLFKFLNIRELFPFVYVAKKREVPFNSFFFQCETQILQILKYLRFFYISLSGYINFFPSIKEFVKLEFHFFKKKVVTVSQILVIYRTATFVKLSSREI